MGSIISKDELVSLLGKGDVAIVDARFVLGKPNAGREAYEASHIPGAVYLDLEQDLSGPIMEHGGRHPLPDVQTLAAKLGSVGISRDTPVIGYDDQGGAMASRLWWLLKYTGHNNARVLDQGWAGWVNAGYEVTSEVPAVKPATYVSIVNAGLVADVARVRSAVSAAQGGAGQPAVLIDSRDGARYRGEVEPLDKKAGHIPTAINRPFGAARDENGKWKPAADQATRFSGIPKNAEVIVYCGSGVTATPNVMALEEAGYTNVKLYAGSWSDWISYSENPIATGEE